MMSITASSKRARRESFRRLRTSAADLSAQYCTINLGGPLPGVVSMLEERGRSNYLASVRNVLDSRRISPGLSCFVPLAHTRAH